MATIMARAVTAGLVLEGIHPITREPTTRLVDRVAFHPTEGVTIWYADPFGPTHHRPADVVTRVDVQVPPAPSAPALGGIDLRVEDITWTGNTGTGESIIAGDPIVFKATVKNYGDLATPAGTILDVAFFIDNVTVSWSDDHTASLAPGATVVLTANSGPGASAIWDAVAGAHDVKATVNSIDRIAESDTTNNSRTESVTVASATPCAAPTPIQVGGPTDHSGGNSPTLTASFTTPVTPGNSVVVIVNSDRPISSASGMGGTWVVVNGASFTTDPGYVGFVYASEVPGTGTTVTVNFDTSGGTNDNALLTPLEVPGPVTDAGIAQRVQVAATPIATPSKTVGQCAIYVAGFAMGDPIVSGPTNGWTAQLTSNRYWASAWYAESDNAAHSTSFTLGAGQFGGCAVAVFYADANNAASGGGGGGGGGSGATPVLLWIGLKELGWLVDGIASMSWADINAAYDGIAVATSIDWHDGVPDFTNFQVDSGEFRNSHADLVAARAQVAVLGFGCHSAKGGPPNGSTERANWLTFQQAFINEAAAVGADYKIDDWEAYPPGDDGSWQGHSTDSANYVTMAGTYGAAIHAAGLKGHAYCSSQSSFPGSNEDEIQFQGSGNHYYGDNRFQDILTGLNGVSGLAYSYVDASFHWGVQNHASATWADGVQHVIALTNAAGYTNIGANVMPWPDNDEGHGYFDPSEIETAVAAGVTYGTGPCDVYEHNALTGALTSEWDAWNVAIALGGA